MENFGKYWCEFAKEMESVVSGLMDMVHVGSMAHGTSVFVPGQTPFPISTGLLGVGNWPISFITGVNMLVK